MAVERLAFPPYFPEVVGGRKIGFDFDFVHDRDWQPRVKTQSA
jgi:hypothetical protein